MKTQLRGIWLVAALGVGACTTGSNEPNGGGGGSSGTAGTESSSAVTASGGQGSSQAGSGSGASHGSSAGSHASGSGTSASHNSGSLPNDSSLEAPSSTDVSGTNSSDLGTGSSDTGTGSSDTGTGSSDTGTGSSNAGTGSSDTGTGSSDTGTVSSGTGTNSSTTTATSGTGGGSSTGTASSGGGTGSSTGTASSGGGTGSSGSSCPSPAICAVGDHMCAADGTLVTCAIGANGCAGYPATGTTCPTHQSCTGTAPSAACSCNPHPNCMATTDTFCANNTTIGTCSQDANQCFFSGPTNACPGASTCQQSGRSAMCSCPAAGMSEGQGCTAGAANICDANGSKILSCVTVQGCSVWAQQTDCASSMLTCGSRGGAPVCQCAANPTGPFYADSVNGTDGTASPFATGVANPPQCRFSTLTKALSVAGAVPSPGPGSTSVQVIATGAAGPAVMTFKDTGSGPRETFPLVVPIGVTLTTSASPPAPGSYVISASNAVANAHAINLRANTKLEGFVVSTALTGTAPTVAAFCDTGNVVVNQTLFNAQGNGGTTNGLQADAACSVTITDSTFDGFKGAGAVMNMTTATTPSTITNGVFTKNQRGLSIAAGTTTVNNINSNNNIAEGVTAGDTGTGSATINAGVIANNGTGMVANQGAGIRWGAPNVTLTINGAAQVKNNFFTGLNIQRGTVNIGTGAVISANGSPGNGNNGGGVRITGGVVTLNAVDVTGNVGPGIAIGGTGTQAPTLTTNLGNFSSNTDEGLAVAGPGLINMTSPTLSANGLQGVSVGANATTVNIGMGTITNNGPGLMNRPAAAGLISLGGTATLNGMTISGNGTSGVHIVAGTVNLSNSAISGNRTAGVSVSPLVIGGQVVASGTPTITLRGNTITGNAPNGTGLNFIGGLELNSNVTSHLIVANDIHGNGGHQVGALKTPGNGVLSTGTWSLNSGNCANMTNNIVHGYSAGFQGLWTQVLSGGGNFNVDAQNVSWAHQPPAAGTDYTQGAGIMVTATNHCAATSP